MSEWYCQPQKFYEILSCSLTWLLIKVLIYWFLWFWPLLYSGGLVSSMCAPSRCLYMYGMVYSCLCVFSKFAMVCTRQMYGTMSSAMWALCSEYSISYIFRLLFLSYHGFLYCGIELFECLVLAIFFKLPRHIATVGSSGWLLFSTIYWLANTTDILCLLPLFVEHPSDLLVRCMVCEVDGSIQIRTSTKFREHNDEAIYTTAHASLSLSSSQTGHRLVHAHLQCGPDLNQKF